MGANIIQFLATISLNSLACIEHTDWAKTSVYFHTTVKSLGRSRWLGFIIESEDWSWTFVCTYIKQFLYILFLNSLACIEHLPSFEHTGLQWKPPSTSTTVKCLGRFLKRWHGLFFESADWSWVRGASIKQFVDIISLNSLTCIETWVKTFTSTTVRGRPRGFMFHLCDFI